MAKEKERKMTERKAARLAYKAWAEADANGVSKKIGKTDLVFFMGWKLAETMTADEAGLEDEGIDLDGYYLWAGDYCFEILSYGNLIEVLLA